ncbi:MAG: hypothetical protein AAFN41_01410 [Planctomycetota bacterium]
MTRTALALLVAGSAAAQPDMLITVDNVSGDAWTISAELVAFTPPTPIVQLWADASFEITGDGSTITFTDYNPAYDTTLGPAQIINGPTASFVGNSNSFFGTPDPSNPLFVANFEYAGTLQALDLQLVGQNTYVGASAGGFDGDLRFYSNVKDITGSLLTWEVQYIPAPGALAVMPVLLAGLRRRR